MSKKEPKGPKSKTTKARLGHAIHIGKRGEAFPEGTNPTKLERAARAVVSIARGNPTQGEIARAESAHAAEKARVLAMAEKSAIGLNKETLALLREAADMPGEKVTDPLDYGMSYIAAKPTEGDVTWRRQFVLDGSDPSTLFRGAVPLSGSSGVEAVVDSSEWSMPTRIPLRTVDISYKAPARIDGERWANYPGDVMPGSTTVTINQGIYDPDNSKLYLPKRPGEPLRPNPDYSLDGQLSFVIGPDGELANARVGRRNSDSKIDVIDPIINVQQILTGLRADILEANMLNQPPDDISGLQ